MVVIYRVIFLWVVYVVSTSAFKSVSRCCVPVKFECYMDVTGGYTLPNSYKPNYVDQLRTRLYYDYSLNVTRTDTNVTLPDGTVFTHSEITYYSQHVSYHIDGSRCQVKHITDEMQPRCIPDDATLVDSAYIGPLKTNTWKYFFASTNVTTIRTVTTSDCMPIVQADYGVLHGGFSGMSYIIGDIARVERPMDITIPSFCS